MSDALWDQVALLLHMEGVNGTTDFKDATYRNVVNAINGAQISTAHKKYGVSSAAFVGGSCRLETHNPGVTPDMTQEAWLRLSAYGSWLRYSDGDDAGNVGEAGGYVHMYQTTTAYPVSALPVDTWFHFAAVRQNGIGYLFVDGVLVWSGAVGTATSDAGTLQIGGTHDVGGIAGHIADLRITKDIARYTATFTPPSAALEEGAIFRADTSPLYWEQTVLLMNMEGTNNATYFRDERHNLVAAVGGARISTAQSKFGAGSAYFDGEGSYLSIPGSANFDFSAEDFTIEFRIKPLSMPATWMRFMQFGANGDTNSLQVYVDNAGSLVLGQCTGGAPSLSALGVISVGEWQDIAISVTGTSGRIFRNGVPIPLSTDVLLRPSSGSIPLSIGTAPDITGQYGSSDFTGYIDGLRITKGIARYTDRFIPPTKAFPVQVQTDVYWPNVVLHLPFDGDNMDIKGHTRTLSTATLSTSAAKFTGSSGEFSGAAAGSQLQFQSDDFLLGSGDFTIEFWAKAAATGGTGFAVRIPSANNAASGVYLSTVNGNWSCYLNGASKATGWGAVDTDWHFYSVSRISEVIVFHKDGVLTSTIAFSAAIGQNNKVEIGGNIYGNQYWYGQLDGVRITKGVARYGSTEYAVPTEPFGAAAVQSLSGTVADENGNYISRTARSYSRATGKLIGTAISDPVTGQFALPAESTDEHFVVVFDDTKNALIYDHVVPVV